jgi:hypothetical protein
MDYIHAVCPYIHTYVHICTYVSCNLIGAYLITKLCPAFTTIFRLGNFLESPPSYTSLPFARIYSNRVETNDLRHGCPFEGTGT